jgi:hypothetical protein
VIRLVALNQDTQTQTTLDLEGSPSIALNLAVAKPGETMQRHAPYSQTFRLPFTDRNNIFFAHFYEVTLTDGDFDPTQKTEVLLFEDGVQVIRGAMQLRAVRLMAETYEVNVLGDVADLFAEMGSKLLEAAFLDGDTFTTDYNYDLTDANVINSQDLNQSISIGDQVPDGTIIIPLADHGLRADQQPLVAQDDYGILNSDISAEGLFPDMLKPAIKLRVLVDLIIRTNGFYWESDFFASDLFGDLYMTLAPKTERAPTEPKFLFRAGLTSSAAVGAQAVTTIVFNNDSTPADDFFDPDAVYSTVTGSYLCPATANYTFVSSGQVTNGGTFQVITIRMVGGNTTLSSQNLVLDPAETQDFSFVATALLAANTAVEVQVWSSQVAAATVDSGTFQCLSNGSGQVDVVKSLPRIKQKDLMRDLCQRFNLVIEADPDNPQRLYIEPYADWIADGVDSYWTDKLDLDKERSLMPTSTIKSSRILFADKESGDIGNKFIKETQGEIFGTYDQDIDDDFATGELKNNPVFAPYFVYPVPTLQGDPTTILPELLIHRSYQKDGVGVKPAGQPPKLFFVTGNVTTSQSVYIGTTALTSYLLCSPFSESPLDADTQSLYWNSTSLPFSVDNALLAGASIPAIGLHQAYWAPYLADIYDADARVYEAHLYLTPSDIRNVRFNDRFHILGATYKLTEISGYQIGTGTSTLCKFLRDLDRSSFGACTAVPTTSNANGTVTFTDADGTTTTNPGQQCCEAFGYFYDATTSTCRWSNPATDDGNPVPPYPPTDAQDPIPSTNGDTPGPVSPTGTNTDTTDPGSGSVIVYDEVILTGESTSNDTIEPVAPGGVPISVPDNVIAVGVIRSTSTTVGGSAGVAFTTLFDTWRFLANGRAGTVTLTETSGESLSSGTPGARRLTAALTSGVLHIYASGEADEIINWSLSVEMQRIYATNESEFEDAILTESGARLAGINDRVLLQE